ncbi:MAG: chromosomal replication initiator protein DnaA [Candidatus Gracilibacteria bacterium]|nr:chromosomal replication initiator protein DnaA [Candidatus Gracilibacteria bacterium]
MEKVDSLKNILNLILKDIKKQDFLVYFRKISIIEVSQDKVIFGVVSGFMEDNLRAKFYDLIKKTTLSEFPNIKEIDFIVDKNIENTTNKDVVDCSVYFKEFSKRPKKIINNNTSDFKTKQFEINKIDEDSSKGNVSDRYTLDNFIVGPSNQLPYSACEAVVRNPGKSYNPLYIYGDVGLGKTHLLQGTGNAILKKYKDKIVRYMTADKFITEYVNAVKKKGVEKLRQKYAEVDVIIIDDVQFLQKKEQTQNEMYNIFNILYDSQKQIIISGDKPPKELTELEPRLRSRFEWGIIVDISKPDFETRLAILQEKARSREFLLPQDVAEFIAANVSDSIRELEGILNQLIAEYELDHSTPSLEKVAKKLKKLSFTTDMLGETKIKKTTTIKSYEDIIQAVSNHFGIEKEGILGENRRKEFMIPRQVAMYLLKTKMHYTYERIGNIFSGRNHAAVLYSCNKLESIIKKDKNLLYEINILRDGIGI